MPIEKNILLQYLSGMGAGLSGQPWAQSLNKITQQNIAAQSQSGLIDLYKQILAGQMPGAKANLSEKGMNLTMPSNVLGVGGGAAGGVEGHMGAPSDLGAEVPAIQTNISAQGNIPTGMPAEQAGGGGFLSKLLNPSDSQPGITPSDLAGLTPQDVSAALSGAMNMEQLRQQQIMNAFKMGQPVKGDPLEGEFPIPHPEAGIITQRQWSSLPTGEREFAAYVHAARKIGAPDEELTREFFSSLEPTEREQFMRAAMEDPELMEATKELSRSGATRITLGEKVAEKKAFADIQGQLYFKDPDWIGDLSKHMSSKGVRSKVLFAEDPGISKSQEKVKYIEDKITAGGGTVQNVKFAEDGKTMIWTIKWPSGDIEEIRHAIRD